MNSENLEFCNLCEKMYLTKRHNRHINSKKHNILLCENNLCPCDVTFDRYTLQEILDEQPQEESKEPEESKESKEPKEPEEPEESNEPKQDESI